LEEISAVSFSWLTFIWRTITGSYKLCRDSPMTRINSLDLFPLIRMRRMRRDAFSRRLMREHTLSVDDLIYPMFIMEGKARRAPIGSMPGIERLTLDELINEAGELR